MSKMSDLMIDLQEAIENGDSFEAIAKQFNVPLSVGYLMRLMLWMLMPILVIWMVTMLRH